MLKEEDRVRVLEGHAQEALRVCRRRGVGDFQAGNVEEPGFGALGVERAGGDAAAGGHADDDVSGSAPAPVDFGQIVDNLIESTRHEIAELHFDHGLAAGNRQAQRGADDRRLAQGRVADAVLAEAVDEALGDLEDAAVLGDVLAHQDEAGVGVEGFGEALGDGVDQAEFAGGGGGLWLVDDRDGQGGDGGVHRAELGGDGRGDGRLCSCLAQTGLDGVAVFRADRCNEVGIKDALGEAPCLEAGARVDLCPVVDEAFRVVFGARRLLVAAHAERLEFKQDRTWPHPGGAGGVAHRQIHRQHIVAVHLQRILRRNTVPDGLVREMRAPELLGRRGRQAPRVVFDADDHGQIPHRGHVHRFVEVAFARSAVAGEHERRLARPVQLAGQGDAVCNPQLRAQMRNHPHQPVLHRTEVERAVAAVRKSVGLALELGEEAAAGDAPRGEYAEVAVHGQDELVCIHRRRGADRDGLLAHAAEPFGDFSLP